MAGRGQLPQTRGPQTNQPRGAGLLHVHGPEPLGGGHHGRITPRFVSEQALTINTADAVSGGALIVGVLGGHQQPSQQPLHYTGQHSARPQGRQ